MTVDYKVFDRDKFTIVGIPTITDDGIASGFNNSNSLTANLESYKPNSFEIKGSFIVSSVHDNYNRIFEITNSGQYYFGMCILNDYKLQLFGIPKVADICTELSINTNDKYFFKTGFKDGFLYMDLSTDNETYTRVLSKAISLPSDYTFSGIMLGKSLTVAHRYLNGSIYLKELSIIVDDKEVFSGSRKGTLVEKLTYLNDTKQIIKSAIEAKGVEVPTETPFRQYANKISEIDTGYQPYTKGTNLQYTTMVENNGNILYHGIWSKIVRYYRNNEPDYMIANQYFNMGKKFEFNFHINHEHFGYTSRISGYSTDLQTQNLQAGINNSKQIYFEIYDGIGWTTLTSDVNYAYSNTDYFIKGIYNGSNKIELYVSKDDNKNYEKLSEMNAYIPNPCLTKIYFCSSPISGSSVRDLVGTIDFNYVNFLYPDEPENNWYAMA